MTHPDRQIWVKYSNNIWWQDGAIFLFSRLVYQHKLVNIFLPSLALILNMVIFHGACKWRLKRENGNINYKADGIYATRTL